MNFPNVSTHRAWFFSGIWKNWSYVHNGKICSIELIFRKAAVKRSLISKYCEEGSLSNGSFVLSSILFIASLSLLRSENRKTSFEQDVQYLTVSSILSRLYVWIFYCISLHLIWFNLIWFDLIPICDGTKLTLVRLYRLVVVCYWVITNFKGEVFIWGQGHIHFLFFQCKGVF